MLLNPSVWIEEHLPFLGRDNGQKETHYGLLQVTFSTTAIAINDLFFAISAQRDVGEGGFGHLELYLFDNRPGKSRFYPDLEINGDRGGADFEHIAVAADHIADMDRFEKGDRFNGDGNDPGTGVFPSHDPAGNIHLRHDPAAENVSVWVGVGRHGQSAENKFAFGVVVCRHQMVFLQ